MGETKVIYHLDEQETPYLVKISVPAHLVTLSDLKNALKKPNYKFFFKSMDDDFGWGWIIIIIIILDVSSSFSLGFLFDVKLEQFLSWLVYL